jgi:hypothetical protein
MIPAETIYVQIGKRRFQVSSFREASEMFCKARDQFSFQTGCGASKTPEAAIVNDAGEAVARISYNGRVWPIAEWHPDMLPLYDNRTVA